MEEPIKTQQDPLCAQIDELQRQSRDERDAKLGKTWDKDVIDLYTLSDQGSTTAPSFRPAVSIPQLQVLLLNEATDITDNNPRIVIIDRSTKKRDKDHEDAFMAHWNRQFWNLELLIAELWAQFAGIGYIQIGFDKDANCGQGEVWALARDPSTVFPDPHAQRDEDLNYIIFEDKLYRDDVVARWPEQGIKVQYKPSMPSSDAHNVGSERFQMPDGPMSSVEGSPASRGSLPSDGRVIVRYTYLKDSTSEAIPLKERTPDQIRLGIDRRPKYPNGRLVIDCEGVVLFDGENPTPFGHFPIVSLTALPRLNCYFPPPATRYSKGLQELAQKFLTQFYENAVRLNNGITYINAASGITTDAYGGVPAEVHVVDANAAGGLDNVAKTHYPAASIPAQMLELPKYLLQLQQFLQGFTPARMGEPTQGNVAKDLYGMSIYESQKLTRLRGKLLAKAVQRFAEIAFYMMAKFYMVNQLFPVFQQDSEGMVADWNPISISDVENFSVHIDPSSIRPVSETAMRQMALPLRQAGMVDTETGLTMLGVPDAKDIAQKLSMEQAAAALAAVTKRK